VDSSTYDPAEETRRDAFAGRLFEATLGAFDLLTIHLGLELGLYRSLADGGPATAAELAARAGIDERYAREWLEQQAVTGVLEVDDPGAAAGDRRFFLPDGHAEALLDPDSLAASAALSRWVVAGASALADLAAAYRSGGGLAWDAYPGLVEAQEMANRPVLRRVLTTEWLPAMADIHDRLTAAPSRIADVACGAGWSTIAMAEAYPHARVDGLDVDPESIERAWRNAAGSSARDRIAFHLVDAGRHEFDGRYDVVMIIEAVHDMSRPVEVLAAARRLLAPEGSVIVVDEKVAEDFMAPGDDLERLFYGYSTLFCLTNSLADPPSVATGTVMRPETLRRFGAEAGFSSVTIEPVEHESFRIYRLRP
jgi:SAM-dependent methyltransferase